MRTIALCAACAALQAFGLIVVAYIVTLIIYQGGKMLGIGVQMLA